MNTEGDTWISSLLVSSPEAWVGPHKRPDCRARLRLFCFPYAGGGASVYRCFPEHLPSDVDVCPVQFPGREARWGEPLFTRIAPLITTLVARAPHIPDRGLHIHTLPDPLLLPRLLEYDRMPSAISGNAEYLQLFLPILRADFELYETYVYLPQDPLDCPIAAFAGLQDRKVSSPAVAQWKLHTNSAFTFHAFPGNHFFIFRHQKSALAAVTRLLFANEIL